MTTKLMKLRRAAGAAAAGAVAAALVVSCGGGCGGGGGGRGRATPVTAAQPARVATEKETPKSPRLRIDFGRDWRFRKGEAKGAQAPGHDDGKWRKVDLPHDWSIEGPFDQRSPGGPEAGYLPGGVGWYRKTFELPEVPGDPGRSKGADERPVSVEFDGVYRAGKAWLNGKLLGTRPSGYASFRYDLTPHVRRGGKKNVLAVRVEAKQPGSLWYTGAGIYRNVYLTVTDPVHVACRGTFLTTPEVSDAEAAVRVLTWVRNGSGVSRKLTIETRVFGSDGTEVAATETSRDVAAGEDGEFDRTLRIARPRRWSPEDPYLYSVLAVVKDGETPLDHVTTPFGVRTFRFDANLGFFLNGRNVKLKGVCMPHDLGPLGAAVSGRAIERRVEIMKAMGANAVRTIGCPPAPELLDACDRLGMLAVVEAFDEWKLGKTKHGYGRSFDEWGEEDLASIVRRDRNHPSVVMWSIGNEVREQATRKGAELAKALADVCRREDPSRPVTAACDKLAAAEKAGFTEALDVVGVNYAPDDYASIHRRFPERKLVATETTAASSSRGVYILPDEAGARKGRDNQLTSYDLAYARGGSTAEDSLRIIRQSPFVAGEFVRSGFDQLGGPATFKWPSRSSYCGIADLCGFPKDRYYLYRSQWTREPMVHILPHWNWEGREGKAIPVWCYTNCDTVELFLNGKSLGKRRWKRVKDLHLAWNVRYRPGTLKAVATAVDGTVVEKVVRTAGRPAGIDLQPDRDEIASDGRDLAFVTVSVRDKDGTVVPGAEDLVKFDVAGPGELVAVGSGNAASQESFQASERKAFGGLCLAVVRSTGEAGEIRLTATSAGLAPATVTVRAGRP